MASEKPTRILMSITEMTEAEVKELSDAEAWRIIYSSSVASSKDERLQVCFTGFSPSQKKVLMRLAEDNNIKVVMSVTKNLGFLCAGENPGPAKLEKAVKQGVRVLTDSQFISMIQTGDISI